MPSSGAAMRELQKRCECLLDAGLGEQRRDWIAGKRIPSDESLRQHPESADEPACAAELSYREISAKLLDDTQNLVSMVALAAHTQFAVRQLVVWEVSRPGQE